MKLNQTCCGTILLYEGVGKGSWFMQYSFMLDKKKFSLLASYVGTIVNRASGT